MEKEIKKNEAVELSAMEEVLEETSVVLEENNDNEQQNEEKDGKKKETSENIELQVEDKEVTQEVTQEAIKEEVSVVVNDELIKKLKMLNSVSSDNETKEQEKSSEA